MAQPLLLELSTLERPQISIDKQGYDVMRPDDLGILDMLRVHRLYASVSQVMALGESELTEPALERMALALDEMIRMLMPSLPPEVFGRLYQGQKLEIVAAFSTLVGWRRANRPEAMSPTGASGSPG